MSRALALVALAAVFGCSGSGSSHRTSVPVPDTGEFLAAAPGCDALATLDSVAMLRDVERLAHDSMGGRLIGSPGALKARDYLAARFDALGLEAPAGGRLQQVPVNSSRLPGVTAAWNVLGIVRGTAQPERWMVVTAHYDHVGIGRAVDGDSIYNGADDNASGAAALAVMAQHLQRHPLGHSVLFAAVDGEERGMPGSRGLADALPMPLADVALNVNLDMVSRNARNELFAAGPGRYPALLPVVESAVRCAPVTLRLGHDTPAAGPGNDWTTQSDHAAFHAKGIPFLYFGVEDHPDYHRPGDHTERIDPAFYVNAVRTVMDVMRRADQAPKE
jgi:Zn-dependent M28 family amino/carboxypeptidase